MSDPLRQKKEGKVHLPPIEDIEHKTSIIEFIYIYIIKIPVAKYLCVCYNSNNSSVIPKVLIIEIEPALVLYQYSLFYKNIYPSGRNT